MYHLSQKGKKETKEDNRGRHAMFGYSTDSLEFIRMRIGKLKRCITAERKIVFSTSYI